MSEIQNFEVFKYYLGKEDINSYDSDFLRGVRDEFKKLKRELIMENHMIEHIMNIKCRYKTVYEYKEGFASPPNIYEVNHGYNKICTVDILKDPRYAVVLTLAYLNESYCKTKITSNNMEICFANQNIKEIERVLRSRRSTT